MLLLPVAHSENGRGEVHVAMTNEKWQRGVGTGIGLSNHVNTYRYARNPPDPRPRTTTLLEWKSHPNNKSPFPRRLPSVPDIRSSHRPNPLTTGRA